MPAQEIIPSGIALDVTVQGANNKLDTLNTNITDIESLIASQKATQEAIQMLNDTMLYFITAMLEKMPRLDVNDRVAVNIEAGNLPTLTNITNVNNLSGGNTNFLPYQIANIGAIHIYDNIKVS